MLPDLKQTYCPVPLWSLVCFLYICGHGCARLNTSTKMALSSYCPDLGSGLQDPEESNESWVTKCHHSLVHHRAGWGTHKLQLQYSPLLCFWQPNPDNLGQVIPRDKRVNFAYIVHDCWKTKRIQWDFSSSRHLGPYVASDVWVVAPNAVEGLQIPFENARNSLHLSLCLRIDEALWIAASQGQKCCFLNTNLWKHLFKIKVFSVLYYWLSMIWMSSKSQGAAAGSHSSFLWLTL